MKNKKLKELKSLMVNGMAKSMEVEDEMRRLLEKGLVTPEELKTLYDVCEPPCHYNELIDKVVKEYSKKKLNKNNPHNLENICGG